jgi:hypothetical protein
MRTENRRSSVCESKKKKYIVLYKRFTEYFIIISNFIYQNTCMTRSSSVGIVTRLRAGRSAVRVPVGSKEFCLLQNVRKAFGGPRILLLNKNRGHFLGLKPVTHYISCIVSDWVELCLSSPLMFHGMDRENLLFRADRWKVRRNVSFLIWWYNILSFKHLISLSFVRMDNVTYNTSVYQLLTLII